MSLSIFLLWLVCIPLSVHPLPAPRGFQLNCGASEDITHGNLKYIPDKGFISVGNKSAIKTADVLPVLSTLRFFPDTSAKKYCYVLPVIKGGKYLVRTTYYYGGYDGGKEPPVFDQIIQGTKWSTVNTTEDYANGMSSYYEIIVASLAKTLSVCLARNVHTTSSPFISALEIEYLGNSVYNSTDFSKYALVTVARDNFGADEEIIGFPDDQFNRLWQPFIDQNPVVECQSNVSSSEFWNFPPQRAFASAITTSRGKTIKIQWPPVSLPSTKYYIALYFQDNRTPSPYSWRVFSVSINGQNFYKDLNVTANGVTVYGSEWPLSGQTEITLTPGNNIPVGPVINAGEIYHILPLGGRTLTRDVMAMENLARRFVDPPSDWSGDPCLPPENSWTGVKCSQDKLARVVALNLTSMGISGSLHSSLANLTAVAHIDNFEFEYSAYSWLGGNKLSGSIPNLSTLKELQTLHLENNKLEGTIPQSLGQLGQLRELFLQNNNLDGRVPDSLRNKKGLNIQVSPGNHQSS
ncbi:LRR receptor-like serine/threonine-protein kinase [Populus alba x Populus x berolinensis]|nr:LRR receptor-like serine/threonine-protein kinase [Populus alba x Populus x berolinensis]